MGFRLRLARTREHFHVRTHVVFVWLHTHACIRAHTHACIRAHTHACIRARTHAFIRACTHACIRARAHACIRARTHACIRARTRAHKHSHCLSICSQKLDDEGAARSLPDLRETGAEGAEVALNKEVEQIRTAVPRLRPGTHKDKEDKGRSGGAEGDEDKGSKGPRSAKGKLRMEKDEPKAKVRGGARKSVRDESTVIRKGRKQLVKSAGTRIAGRRKGERARAVLENGAPAVSKRRKVT